MTPKASLHTECFGHFLRAQRLARGMTQTELAERVGLSTARISQYELGEFDKLPPIDVALRMGNTLRTWLPDILDAGGVNLFEFDEYDSYTGPGITAEHLQDDLFARPEAERHTANCIQENSGDAATARRAREAWARRMKLADAAGWTMGGETDGREAAV